MEPAPSKVDSYFVVEQTPGIYIRVWVEESNLRGWCWQTHNDKAGGKPCSDSVFISFIRWDNQQWKAVIQPDSKSFKLIRVSDNHEEYADSIDYWYEGQTWKANLIGVP